MTTAHYQVAVIGDHLGGMAAAALAARRGGRVLLLETAPVAPRPFELLNAVAGAPEHEPALGRVFQALGLAPFGPLGDDRIHFHALAPPLQLCLPGHRTSLHADRTARAWELQREFGDAQRALAQLLALEEQLRARLERPAAQPGSAAMRALSSVSGFVRLQALEREVARGSFAQLLDREGLDPALRSTLELAAQAVCRRPVGELSWAHGVRALRVAGGGLCRNAAGQGGVLEGLRGVLLARGGDARPLVALEGIEAPRTGGARLHLAAGGTVKADRVVIDLPVGEALRLLPAESVKALERKGVAERAEGGYALLEFAIAPERRPEGMGTFLAVVPPGADPAAGPALLAARTAGEAVDGRVEMEALCLFPAGGEDAARTHLLACVRSILPFYDESLAGEPVWRTGPAPRYTRERLARGQREERLAAGWATGVFASAPFTLLRNEDYAAVPLAEALFSGALAVS